MCATVTKVPGQNKVVMFGGRRAGGRLSDLHGYDVDTGLWTRLHDNDEAGAPCRRDFHTAVACRGSLLLFGGSLGDHRVNDVHRYSFGPEEAVAVPAAEQATADGGRGDGDGEQ